jgi:hypothetical protein
LSTYKVHSMGISAYCCAIGLPFPEAVVEPNGRVAFVFQDPLGEDGAVQAACQEFQSDRDGTRALVSAPRLLESWRELKKLLPQREARL